jgi:cytochrome P450
VATKTEEVPGKLVVDFDIYDPRLAGDVHRILAGFREKTPIAWNPLYGGHWMVMDYRDAYDVLRNPIVFSSTLNAIPSMEGFNSIPLEVDPPDHTAYRHILNALFSPGRMEALGDTIRSTANRLIDGFGPKGECEFMSAFAQPLPTTLFLSMMGWPQSDEPQISRWTEHILIGQPGGTEEESTAVRTGASAEVFGYFTNIISERRKAAKDDFTQAIIDSQFRAERPLTDDELLRMFWLLMLGGLHTVRGVLGFSIIDLSQNPAERQRLVDDPSLTEAAVEEMLRLGAPVAPGRVVTEPVEVGGIKMEPGDRVVVFLSSANRDPVEFDAPDDVRVDRKPNRHLTFSNGPHRCLGSHLGRLELVIALQEIHRRIPDYRLIEGRPPVLHHSQVKGLVELPIEFSPEPAV